MSVGGRRGRGNGVPLRARVARVMGSGKRHDILSLFLFFCAHYFVRRCPAVGMRRSPPFWCLHRCPLMTNTLAQHFAGNTHRFASADSGKVSRVAFGVSTAFL